MSIDYPTTQEFLDRVIESSDKQPVDKDLFELAINGSLLKEPMSNYLSHNAISSSALAKAKISPKAVKYEFDNQVDEVTEKTKDFLNLGTLIHQALLEPELFKKVRKEPKVDLRTTEGVKELIRFYTSLRNPKPTYQGISKMKIHQLRKILNDEKLVCKYYVATEAQYSIIEEIKKNYYSYGGGIIPALLKGAFVETSIYTQEPNYYFTEKIRPDFFNIEENIGVNLIASLKSTSAKSLEEFLQQARTLNYGLKEGFYQRVMSHVTGRQFAHIIIGLQTTPPYDVFILLWNKESIEIAIQEAAHYADIINDCFKSGIFLGMESKAEEGNRGIIEFDLYGDYVPELPCFTV